MRPGSHWEHYKGGVYAIVAMCRLESTLEPHVIYVLASTYPNGSYWCRPLSEWNQEVSPGVRRFTEVSE